MPVCSTCGTHYGSTVRICVRDGTPLVAGRADDVHIGQLLDGKYQIESFISSGGMGSVYRAQHVMLGKTVAVKLIKNELITSDDVVSRFQREARAASNLNHPNIVTVYDLGQASDGTLYIAMEFIDGPSLKDAIRRDGPLPPSRAVDILRQVASALSAAHRKQIVHRDLKSHNLMLAPSEDGRTVVKLVDFGVAKTFDESTQLTAAGYMLGTPHYMSPEQAAGKPVDHRADLYSLGVILYEMMTGSVPFSDESLTSVLVKLATEVPPAPSVRRPDLGVPAALDAVAMRCLAKNPEDRFQSADEFADALDRADTLIREQRMAQPIPAAAATLVRPPAPPRRPSSPAAVPGTVPQARPRSGLSIPQRLNRRVAAVILVLAAVALPIAFGVGLSDDPAEEDSPTEASQLAATVPPAPATVPAPTPVPAPSAVDSPSPGPAGLAPPLDNRTGRGNPPVAGSSSGRAQSAAPSAVTPPPPQAAPAAEKPPAPPVPVAVPVPAPVAVPAPAPAPAPPPPSVAVGCKGFPEVCAAIRSEILRSMESGGFAVTGYQSPADIVVTAVVSPVSETASTQFGTPIITITYSVELIGNARGVAVAMPAPHLFGFDPVFGRARILENARLIAAGAVESVRAFVTRTRP